MKNCRISFRTILILIITAILPIVIIPTSVNAGHIEEPRYFYGSATHRACWYPEEPNVYVEVTLDVEVICYPGYMRFYYNMYYKVGTVWCVSNIYAVETSIKYNTPEPGITTATVHRRFAYWFIVWPIIVEIKCQVHFDENTGLFYYSEWVRSNGAIVAQAIMENFPWDSLYKK